jgi:hypothetical protein
METSQFMNGPVSAIQLRQYLVSIPLKLNETLGNHGADVLCVHVVADPFNNIDRYVIVPALLKAKTSLFALL